MRKLRITGGPQVHTLRVVDAETGQELHVRGVRIEGGFGTAGPRMVTAWIQLPCTVDVEAGSDLLPDAPAPRNSVTPIILNVVGPEIR